MKGKEISDAILSRLKTGGQKDMNDLLPHLTKRANELAKVAMKRLIERGEAEAKDMVEILQSQKKRVSGVAEKYKNPQLSLEFDQEEKRQLESNRRHWSKRLTAIDGELVTEPARIRNLYQIKAQRIEPAGLVYLWPVTG